MGPMPFFQLGPLPANQVEGYFDLKLVFLSYIVAIFASYIALSIVDGLRSSIIEKVDYWKWFVSGAIVMGMGIWTMHFIGMEALVLFIPIQYDSFLTFLSLVIAAIASGFALFWVTRPRVTSSEIVFGGVLMGLGIASMHYVGMAAMVPINISYIPSLFFLSILIAIIASQVALWLMIKSQKFSETIRFNILSAIFMGLAICGMHYMGMAAAVMTSDAPAQASMASHSGLPTLYIGLVSAAIMIIFLALSSNNQKHLVSLQKINENLRAKEIELSEARKRAEQASEAKSFFLANMSHEIRTPLNVIVGTASLLSRSELTNSEKKFVDRITTSSQLLLNLIIDILDFSKIEAGKLTLTHQDTEFVSLVREVVNISTPRAEHKNLKISINYDTNKPLYITTDPIRLQQVMINLLGNAIKFTHDGQITINIIPKQENNNRLPIRLEVVDTGIGISEEKFGAIFQKFSQIDTASTRTIGGVGLGLVICKELVKLLGGEIGFTSQVGKGSTFWFEISFAVPKGSVVK